MGTATKRLVTRNRHTDPDKAFRNLEDESEYKYLLLDSPMAEQLFAAHYLDLELDPYQVLLLKFLRGRFHSEEEVWRFIDENQLDWMFNNGWIRHGNNEGVSPYYWDKPNILALIPAGFGKTTIVTAKVLPVIGICDNPNARFQMIGKNETDAFSFSRSIRRELTNSKLQDDFGVFQPTDRAIPWSDQAFSVAQREWRDVRENFEFYGTNSHAELGKRSDFVYIDDVETPDTARTPEMRQKLLEWMRIGPFTSARPLWSRDKQGNVLIPQRIHWSKTARYWGVGIVGTIFNPEALYATVMRDPTFTCIKFDCYRDRKCTQSLSDRMLTVDDLKREQKSIGVLAFNKRYRNIAYNEEEMAFRESWVRGQEEEVNGQRIQHPGCLDTGRSFGCVYDGEETFLGFDPASGSKSRWSAYSAYVVLAFDKTDEQRRVFLVDYLKIQDNFDRMLDHLLGGNEAYAIDGFLQRYNYRIGTVEKNAFGKWIVDNDRMKPYVLSGVIRPHDTGNNKTDPEAGVFAMGEMIQSGRFRIPYSTAADQEKAENFIADLLLYPKGTCDLVMALWLAQKPIRTMAPQYKSWFAKGGRGRIYKNPVFD